MMQRQETAAEPDNVKRDTISITCPPVPNGPGNGLSLQSSFSACGTWNSSSSNYSVAVSFQTPEGLAERTISYSPTSLLVNSNGTWAASFSIPAGTSGTLYASLTVNGSPMASQQVTDLSIASSGGGTCTC
jgi:hypothetical protein